MYGYTESATQQQGCTPGVFVSSKTPSHDVQAQKRWACHSPASQVCNDMAANVWACLQDGSNSRGLAVNSQPSKGAAGKSHPKTPGSCLGCLQACACGMVSLSLSIVSAQDHLSLLVSCTIMSYLDQCAEENGEHAQSMRCYEIDVFATSPYQNRLVRQLEQPQGL